MSEEFLNRRNARRTVLNLPCAVKLGGKKYEGEILDFSLSGVRVNCGNLSADLGTLLSIAVPTDRGQIDLGGKIARKMNEGDSFGVRLGGDVRELGEILKILVMQSTTQKATQGFGENRTLCAKEARWQRH